MSESPPPGTERDAAQGGHPADNERSPIRQWSLRNFKSVSRATLDLGPLTVIVGANSSGKSSVLQSILLAVQAAQASAPGSVLPLNGPLVQLGDFGDVHSVFAPGQRSEIGGVFEVGGEGQASTSCEWRIEFAGRIASQPGSTNVTSVSLAVRRGSVGEDGSPILTLRAKRRPGGGRPRRRLILGGLLAAPRSVDPSSIAPWPGTLRREGRRSVPIEGVNLVAGYPTHFLVEADEHRKLAEMWVAKLRSRIGFDGVRTRSQSAARRQAVRPPLEALSRLAQAAADDISDWLRTRPEGLPWQEAPEFRATGRSPRGTTARDLRLIVSDLTLADALAAEIAQRLGPGEVLLEPVALPDDAAIEPLTLLAQRVSYLGPLRQEPQVVYRIVSPVHPRFVGTRGEFVPAVLHRLRNELVFVPMPGGEIREVRLQEALNAWLSHLEAASTIEVQDRGRLGYELRVVQPDLPKAIDLLSVGVGVSQVVPVLLICLLAAPGSVVLLEQPELHLHPAMQQRLGDFFLALARSGRQLIVETHSEYLVTRLRSSIAEDPTERTSGLVRVVNAAKVRGRTQLTPIPINPYGSIEEWPAGFFDQASTESQRLLIAGLQKRDADHSPDGDH